MEIVENKTMFYIVQNTPLNQKYHNYELARNLKQVPNIIQKELRLEKHPLVCTEQQNKNELYLLRDYTKKFVNR